MKSVKIIFIAFVALLSWMEAFASDLTLRDLEGFKRPQTILKYKDLKLPNPEPPLENGINSGGVIILGRYMPPPYEVTVSSDGKHVLINGVPCTNLNQLVDPGLDEKQMRVVMIKSDIEEDLRNVYQRTKHFKGEKEAERKLREKINLLENIGYKNLGMTKTNDISHIVTAQVSFFGKEKKTQIRLNIKEGEDPVKAINRQFAIRGKPVKIKIYNYETEPYTEKKYVVHLNHPETGKFDVEVESKQATKIWICNEGTKCIQDKKMELQGKYGHFSENKIEQELTKFALSIPWVQSFKCMRDAHSQTLAGFIINGVNCGFLLSYIPENTPTQQKSVDERIEEYHQRQEKMRREMVKLAEEIKETLERNRIIVLDHDSESLENYPELLPSMRKIMNSSCSIKEKKDKLVEIFYQKQKAFWDTHAGFIAVYWNKPWGQEK